MNNKKINILFIGDIFGEPGIQEIKKTLLLIVKKHNIQLVVAQAENVSGRKGLQKKDYLFLKKLGVDVFTLGNHVWAKDDVHTIINNNDVVRPLNINENLYYGEGTRVVKIGNFNIRITSLLGISFNKLMSPWKQEYANNFFDAIDKILENDKSDFHIIDFHAETTSEKNVLGLYLDGKVDALIGTHTHVQTNDAQILENGTLFITDVGMTGPTRSAIGANYKEVYERMRYEIGSKFKVSLNPTQFNAVVLKLNKINKTKSKILAINTLKRKI